jgi:hypothetical protein
VRHTNNAPIPTTQRIVLSRKGFDSASGGGASPVLPDGRMISLPIPDPFAQVRYADLEVDGRSLLSMMHGLGYRRYHERDTCHLDPDINSVVRPRAAEWRGLFGQTAAALGHLRNQMVGVGDLFLFWGRFRHTQRRANRLAFAGDPFHAVYGYLQIGHIYDCERSETAWYAPDFPHFAPEQLGQRTWVFEAADRLAGSNLPGYGVFDYRDELRLTCAGATLSTWQLPDVFHPSHRGGLTYHVDPSRWEQPVSGMTRLRTVGRGQEFVSNSDQVATWAHEFVTRAAA